MADNKIKVIIDVVGDKASTSLRNFRSDLTSTEGAFGKMKVAGSAAFDQIRANAGNFAMAAGAALVGFAAKAVGEFQKVALEAGNFAASTGMAVENASRWTAVVKPLGVELGDLQDVFNNLAGLIDTNDAALQQLGVTIAKDKSGRVDMNETVLRIIESLGRVEDPAKRAAMAARFFGEEGSRQFAPLIEQSAKLRDNLAAVSDEKVIDSGELKKAREFRDAMLELRQKTEDLAMTLGESLVPTLTDLAEVAGSLGDVLGAELPGGIKLIDAMVEPIAGKFRAAGDSIQQMKGDLYELDPVVQGVTDRLKADALAAEEAEVAAEDLGSAFSVTTLAIREASGALDLLRGSLNIEEAVAGAEEAIAGLAAEGGKTAENMRRAKEQVIGAAEAIGGLSKATQTRLAILIDTGQLQAALDLLNRINTQRRLLSEDRIPARLLPTSGGKVPGKAVGGPVSAGKPYLVGEEGPELMVPSTNGSIVPNHQLKSSSAPSGGSTSNTYSITVNVAPGGDPANTGRMLVEAIQDYERVNSSRWRAS
jgi:hypothetical protein